jgi:hypothetical protein
MDYRTAIAFIGGAIAGNYLVRKYITRRPHHDFKPVTYEQVQNEVELNKYTQQRVETDTSQSPYASLYSNKK